MRSKCRKIVSRHENTSSSKDSTESRKRVFSRLNNHPTLSKAEIELRLTIEKKYAKSKIKNYVYGKQRVANRDSSPDSTEIRIFNKLCHHGPINLKQLHADPQKDNRNKYMIRVKAKDSSLCTGKHKQEIVNRLKGTEKGQIFSNRKAVSEQKHKICRIVSFDWHSISKQIKSPVTSPSHKLTSTESRTAMKSVKTATGSRIHYK